MTTKILIKFPTRERPEKFFQVLSLYYQKAKDLSNIEFLISCDLDDSTMNNPVVIKKLENAKKHINLNYYFGNSKTKIEAVNADIEKCKNWDILLLASDDMIPICDGYDQIIRDDMFTYHRNGDGVLWYNDGNRNDINTLCIFDKKYYERFNYIYNPEYTSLWCDNEFTEVSQFLGKCSKINKIIIEHAHPAYQKANFDKLYVKNESFFKKDEEIFNKRKNKNFELNKYIPYLSILTPSVPSRITKGLQNVMDKIEKQIKENNLDKKVEHLIHIDNKVRTIGRKRDNLVQCAIGQYVAFVDDDDDISNDYVLELVNAIKNNPNVDVITFKQNCFIENYPKSIVKFGLGHENEAYAPNVEFKRKPYHICAWKGTLSKKFNFPSSNYGEDVGWLYQLWEVAKTEYYIDKVLHSYIHSNNTSEANVATRLNNQI
jgi:hypothetical protein